MRTHKASQQQSSVNNSLVSRPFVVQPKAEERKESPGAQGYESQMPEFTIFNPAGEQSPVQAKLAIGAPGDKYEQEADRTAKLVVQRINAPAIARSTSEPSIQRRGGLEGGEASTDLESAITSARSRGQPLDAGLQAKMSTAMGADFSGVRVHTDAQSDQLNRSIQAKAFTTGQDVFFRQGEYQPGSRGGQELIAHELTHVVQQSGGISYPIQKMKTTSESRGEFIDLIFTLLFNKNISLAKYALEVRVDSGEFDQEDVEEVGEMLSAHEIVSKIHTSGLKTETNDEIIGFLDIWDTSIKEQKEKAKPPSKEEAVIAGTVEADEGFVEKVPGPGKKRIQVPTGTASAVQIKNLSEIRWSQSDVKSETQGEGATPITTVIKHMIKGGWRGDPCSVVQMTDKIKVETAEVSSGVKAGLVSQDNRRLLAAKVAGLTQVPCIIKSHSDPLPESWPVEYRDKIGKHLYLDTSNNTLRYGASGEGFKQGKPTNDKRFKLILQKGHIASTYGELILIRTANQPAVKATGESFEIGGSSETPYMKPKTSV
ncbi:eCIS core domain-containing protein [Aliinostoc sp. HNIBRCY26]|uniref:eCIS core domain-containing protein n=1 Tax=Aliinostoc sp. HNIBRCY26 TaxID=3418997 RepID=UPI003D02E610